MGLFGDLFKAADWNETELQAIWITMLAMAHSDGEATEDETEIIGKMLDNLPASESVNWEEIVDKALKMKPEQAFNTLKDMSSKKRTIAVAMLGGVAQADGNLDDAELKFFFNVAKALNVKLPSQK